MHYNYEEAFNRTFKYFNSDELATKVWLSKYCLKGGDNSGHLELTPDDMHRRITDEIYRIESSYDDGMSWEEIYRLLKDFKYVVFQGSPMTGIGNNNQIISLSNCFFIKHKADSYSAILDVDEKLANISKRRGGTGLDISSLRPSGGKVNNASLTSTGSVSFAKRYSYTANEVGAEGRRAALMISEHVRHPDIYQFIKAKLDTKEITGANVSVKVGKEFMDAVNNNDYYIQRFPIDLDISGINADSLELNELVDIGNGKYVKKVDAFQIWELIANSAWRSAEPGLLFWDQFKTESTSEGYEGHEILGVNPCVTGDTKILTDQGYDYISNLVGKLVNVWNGKEFSNVIPKVTGENKDILKIKLSDGRELKCTKYHIWYIWKGYSQRGYSEAKEAKDLKVGDKIQKYDFPVISFGKDLDKKQAYTQGFYCGDGTKNTNRISLYGEKINLIQYLSGDVSGKLEDLGNGLFRQNFLINFDVKDNYFVPKNWSVNSRLDWLAGLFDADGTITNDGDFQLFSINKNFLFELQDLLSTLGVNAKIVKGDDEGKQYLSDGKGGNKKYNCKESNRILLGAKQVELLKNLGLNTNRLNIKDIKPNRDASRFVKVESIEEQSEKESKVYCFTEYKEHKGVFNGILTGQCGEISLPDLDSCRLLAINLFNYVEKPFTKDAYFNWSKFRKDVRKAQKLMDDLVDLEIEKVDKIIDKINSSDEDEHLKFRERNLWENIKRKGIEARRTGLGITAEGDMLAALGFTYGTEEATDFSEYLHKNLAVESYIASINMAKVRGSFDIWDYNKEKDNPFINRIFGAIEDIYGKDVKDDIWYDYYGFGRRNIANLTIAPTGTVSLMTQTTSGVEPVFLPFYKRRRKVNDKELASFTDEVGNMWEEFKVFHYKFIEWYMVYANINDFEKAKDYLHGLDENDLDSLVSDSPYKGATMEDVNYEEKVKMQGRIQKWVDHSISVTINLPQNEKLETVQKLYNIAYDYGCKGVTVYREGSRTGVLVSNNQDQGDLEYIDAVKRGKELECDIHRLTALKKRWMVVVGKKFGKPYEIFALREPEASDFAKKYVKGKIIKRKRGVYDLVGENHSSNDILEDISQYYDNDDERASTRKYSLMLRHRIHPKFIAETIEKEPGSLVSFQKAIARILRKNYVSDNENVTGDACPNCGSNNLKYVSGCVECADCGFQKC